MNAAEQTLEQTVRELEEKLFTHPSFQGVRDVVSMTMPNTGHQEPLEGVLRRAEEYGPAMRSLWKSVLSES